MDETNSKRIKLPLVCLLSISLVAGLVHLIQLFSL